MDPRYSHQTYILKKQFLKLLGENFRIYDSNENLVFFGHQKAFKLKEDIRVYADEGKSRELLIIKARKIMDFAASYDVQDAETGEKIGALKRKGWKSSLLRDSWIIMDQADRDIGMIEEDRAFVAFLRRWVEAVSLFLPQSYDVMLSGQKVADFTQHFNPFLMRMTLDFSMDVSGAMDRRLGIAAAVLIAAIEGRQG